MNSRADVVIFGMRCLLDLVGSMQMTFALVTCYIKLSDALAIGRGFIDVLVESQPCLFK